MIRVMGVAAAAVALGMFGCGGEKQKAEAPAVNQSVVAGGWSESQTADKDAQAAAEFAVREMTQKTGSAIKLKKVLSVQKQVVAGMNYKLVLLVDDGKVERQADVVVWRKLDNTSALTSFVWR